MSVGVTTRSAFRGRSNIAFKAKLGIVIEEADECDYWLELLMEEPFELSNKLDEYERLHLEADELSSIFVSIVKNHEVYFFQLSAFNLLIYGKNK